MCPTCGRFRTTEDNFCRRCGRPFGNENLPVLYRRPGLPERVSRALQPFVPISRGIAMIAVGAGLAVLQQQIQSGNLLPWRRKKTTDVVKFSEAVVVRQWVSRSGDR